MPAVRRAIPGQAPGSAHLSLAPFRGVRYAEERVGDLATVTSPPYDVIDGASVSALMAAQPHNVVRLILPQDETSRPGERYHRAAMTLRGWLADRILVPDPRPALYVYEEAGRPGSGHPLQRGLIGALGLVPPEAGIVLPHEDVLPGPVADRLHLMSATEANFEPIFLLYDGEGGAATAVVDSTADTEPLATATTDDSVTHRLWAVTDPGVLDAVARDLAQRRALIADGHHRYATYMELQARRHAEGAGAGPWDRGLALLVDSRAYPPRLGAIHRVIPGLTPGMAARAAAALFDVRPASAVLPDALAELAAAGRRGPAYLLAGAGRHLLLSDPDPDEIERQMPAGHSTRWRHLPTSVLQEVLIPRLWGIREDEHTVRVVHHDAAQAIRAAEQVSAEGPGTVATAVILNPLRAAEVFAIAEGGERVPRKSTSFGPKPRTGLVLRTFAHG